ncbi:hypothetical protein EVAR_17582_1 [Eumeta japonica]|uniref:Uncharacterized protein n=1 Tax=Eumeta variegata TaxID=151549 RepID=A0A4C1UDF0_EUMVA|nr:hypothetical protein EVAR_17582_1 [Eumeta japonica]
MSYIRNFALAGRTKRKRLEPRRALRYGRESVFRAHVALMRKKCKVNASLVHPFILEMTEMAKDIFSKLSKLCGLSGTHVALNCHAQPHCVKYLVPHWTKEYNNKEARDEPSCCNCGQKHTANYGGCQRAP